jgi:hypothetical protein
VLKFHYIKKELAVKKSFILVFAFFLFIINIYAQDRRGLELSARELGLKQNTIGKQYLVLIAVDRYEKWFPLKNPVRDVKEIKKILTSLYYINDVIELYDQEATKANIIRLFENLIHKLKVEDSLLIIYAGHGYLDEITDTGFWIPVNAGTDVYAQENWLPNTQIRGLISKLKASHICLIADACFSGDILNSTRGISPTINNEYFKKAYERTSRQVLTSGASETVPDRSEFCRLLKMALEKNKNSYLDPVMLYNEIRLGVKNTLPMIGNLKETGHQDGASFILFLRTEEETAKKTEPKIEHVPKEDKAAKTSAVAESKEKQTQENLFEVSSQKLWQDTGIVVNKGDHVIIKYVSGKWTENSVNALVDAEGDSTRKFGDFPHCCLIGKVGQNAPFFIGNHCDIKEADETGKLYVKINSDNSISDNVGSIKIRIMVNVEKESAEKTTGTAPATAVDQEKQAVEDSFTFLTEYEGHRYYISKQIDSWSKAKIICEKNGGHLVTITSAEENQAIISILKAKDISYGIWIGYTKEGVIWVWITGEKSDFKYWGSHQSNVWISDPNYALILPNTKYKWDYIMNESLNYFILETEP